MEVAARENAMAQESLHDLQDLVTKIAENEKLEESKDLATDIQDSLATPSTRDPPPEKNRGVSKAPFVVLVGADMPSVLSEISFGSNSEPRKVAAQNGPARKDRRRPLSRNIFLPGQPEQPLEQPAEIGLR